MLETAAPAVIAPIVDLPKTEFAEEGPASAASGPFLQTGGAGSGTGGNGAGTGSQSGSGGGHLQGRMAKAEQPGGTQPQYAAQRCPRCDGERSRTAKTSGVTECRLWGESPKGSGYGEAVLNISDLFRVKPPVIVII